MKDYKLSEIKEMCKSHPESCKECELFIDRVGCGIAIMNLGKNPEDWDIDEEQPKDKIETLEDIINLMASKDYKDRFKAEYCQLKIRYEKLDTMVKNWKEGKLDFIPTCSKEIYEKQLNAMSNYILMLEVRAKIEGIELN